MSNDEIRVRIEFKNLTHNIKGKQLVNSWISYDKNVVSTVKSLEKLIIAKFDLTPPIQLWMDDAVLPRDEVNLLRDRECVVVQPAESKTKKEKSSKTDDKSKHEKNGKKQIAMKCGPKPKLNKSNNQSVKTPLSSDLMKWLIASKEKNKSEVKPQFSGIQTVKNNSKTPKSHSKTPKDNSKSPKSDSKALKNNSKSSKSDSKSPKSDIKKKKISKPKSVLENNDKTPQIRYKPDNDDTQKTPKTLRRSKPLPEEEEPLGILAPVVVIDRIDVSNYSFTKIYCHNDNGKKDDHRHVEISNEPVKEPVKKRKQNARKSFPSPEMKDSDKKESERTKKAKIEEFDYESCEPLFGFPNIGDTIAFRMITESDGLPETSDFIEGIVLNFDNESHMMDLMLIRKINVPENNDETRMLRNRKHKNSILDNNKILKVYFPKIFEKKIINRINN